MYKVVIVLGVITVFIKILVNTTNADSEFIEMLDEKNCMRKANNGETVRCKVNETWLAFLMCSDHTYFTGYFKIQDRSAFCLPCHEVFQNLEQSHLRKECKPISPDDTSSHSSAVQNGPFICLGLSILITIHFLI
ncbi:uncharacterized protein LOC131948234 [Physella acuta]|uniref:uncharacterized protein LOC131948234 n=1 Tax=Physella acuta TaxID=109671 RepID=UPI0027DB4E83|nr:uncharacterized protein LOC131948234 [Physella acuta]